MDKQRILGAYANNYFATNDPAENNARLRDLAGSGLTSLVLWPVHLKPNGDLCYGDAQTRIVSNGVFQPEWAYLPPLLDKVRTQTTVRFLNAGTGGAPPDDPKAPDDYRIIKGLLATPDGTALLRRNFGALAKALGLDGFELDFEDGDSDPTTTVKFTLLLSGLGLGVTYAPYQCREFWRQVLAQAFAANNGKQPVRWFNLQCYDGGASEHPADWVTYLRQSPDPLGIADPAAFIHPGLWTLNVRFSDQHCVPIPEKGVYCPKAMAARFAEFKQAVPGLTNAFLWNLEQIYVCAKSGGCGNEALTVKAYADAMINGLR